MNRVFAFKCVAVALVLSGCSFSPDLIVQKTQSYIVITNKGEETIKITGIKFPKQKYCSLLEDNESDAILNERPNNTLAQGDQKEYSYNCGRLGLSHAVIETDHGNVDVKWEE